MSGLIETLASYVPTLIARRLATDLVPLTEPTSERFPAAVLFADISGFTALTERLAEEGPAGAETLTRELNSYFGQMIDIITSHGGDVVKFAGDALTAIWPALPLSSPPVGGTGGGLSLATQQAAACALAIQAALQDYRTADGSKLVLSIGLGAGNVAAVYVGGIYDRWEFVITGPPLTQASQAEGHARPGEVVISPEAWALIQTDSTGHAVAEGYMRLVTAADKLPAITPARPTLPSEIETPLRSYIPAAILTRLAAGQGGWLAELRRVTVLFINLPDLTFATPLDQGHAATQALQQALYRYEGSVNKISVDDKGTTLVAALGLPPMAHEDDAARGVQAALAMHAILRHSLNWDCAIGVTTGRAFCGSVGNETRREYTMMGDVVNLAARLMQAAGSPPSPKGHSAIPPQGGEVISSSSLRTGLEGGELPIFCDEETYQAAQSQINFDVLTPIKVKGKAQIVAIYRPNPETSVIQSKTRAARSRSIQNRKLALSEVEGSKIEMVGRAVERQILADSLQQLQGGQSGLIIIEGEAGIGKSRLVEELIRQAEGQNTGHFLGWGDAIEKSTPYHAWRPVFSQLFGFDTQTEDVEAWQAQAQTHVEAVDSELVRLLPLLNAVLPLHLPDNDLTAQMSGEVRADNTHDLLVQVLVETNRDSPLLLVIEDAHWLDSASWALLRLVSQGVQPLLLVIATRPISEPLPAEYKGLLKTPRIQRLKLAALPLKDAMTLVCNRLGVTALPQPVSNLILEKAEGHPFFSEEIAYALRDANLIEINNGECRLAPGAGDFRNLEFPDTIEGVITSRIDQLEPQHQLALKVASVIGRVFTLRTLRDIHPIEVDKPLLPEYLTALERLDLTPLEAPEPELAYIFKHIITQEVAYNLMAFAQRQTLHQALAEWLEQTHADDLAPYYPLLVHHWSLAQVTTKRLDYLEKAGEQALRDAAYQEAEDFLSQLIALAESQKVQESITPTRLARWYHLLAEACLGLSRLDEATAHFQRTLALLGQPWPGSTPQLALKTGWNYVRLIFRSLIGRNWARQPTQPIPADNLTAFSTYRSFGRMFLLQNNHLFSLYAVTRMFLTVAHFGLSSELAQAYALMVSANRFMRLSPLAEIFERRADAIIARLADSSSAAYVLFLTGNFDIGYKSWSHITPRLEQAAHLWRQLGDKMGLADVAVNLMTVYHDQGNFRQGVELGNEVVPYFGQANLPQQQAWSLTHQAHSLLALGQIETAVSNLELARSLYPPQPLTLEGVIDTYGTLAAAYWRQGQPEAARQMADVVFDLASQRGVPSIPTVTEAYSGPAEVYLGLWETALKANDATEAAALQRGAKQAIKLMRYYAFLHPVARPRAWRWQGLYQWLAGKHRRAHRIWRKSLAEARKRNMPYEEGLTHYQIGRHLAVGDPKREEHLNRTVEIFTRLEAAYDLSRAEGELRDSGQ